MISQCIANIVHHQLRWELIGGDACCLVPHQIVTLEIQQARIGAFCLLAPCLECRAIVNVRRDDAIVKGKDQFVIYQHIRSARLMLKRLNVLD